MKCSPPKSWIKLNTNSSSAVMGTSATVSKTAVIGGVPTTWPAQPLPLARLPSMTAAGLNPL